MGRIYKSLAFPPPPKGRPYVFANMIATVDGKTVSGERTEHVMDLGSPADHEALRDLEAHADAVMIGARTLRATPKMWYPNRLWKVVVTRSGDLPWESRFFSDDPTRAIVVGPAAIVGSVPKGAALWPIDEGLPAIFARLRAERNVRLLAVEGGSELNAHLIRLDLIDEFFLTIAPKLKLGVNTPTFAGGEPFDREEIQSLALVSCEAVGDEVFLRYRRKKARSSRR